MKNMIRLVAIVIILAVMFYACTSLMFSRPLANDLQPGSSLDYAALLVAAAVFASITFGVVTYIESALLQNRITRLMDQVRGIQRKHSDLADSYCQQYYDLSIASFVAMLETVMSMPFPNAQAFQAAVRQLELATISVHLSHGSYLSLFHAIQIAYTKDQMRFLNMESEVSKKARLLRRRERKQLLRMYQQRKGAILQRAAALVPPPSRP